MYEFFKYYNDTFDFTRDVGSVRTGGYLWPSDCQDHARQHKIGPGQWDAYIGMEEPFERTNAARAVINREMFDKILHQLARGYNMLDNGARLSALLYQ